MSYQWRESDIAVVQRYLRELEGDKSAVTEALLEILPTLVKEEILIAIEIAEQVRLYEKGELTLAKLFESQSRLGIIPKKTDRFNYI